MLLEALQAEIRHHGGDDARFGEPPVRLPALRDHREQLVAVDHMAALVDQITRSASPSSAMPMSARISRTLRLSASGEVEPTSLVDVETVRLDADRNHLGAQLPQRFRHDLVGGAIGAIDHHAQAVERRSRGSVRLANSM
jgi:hypothetical protein